MGRLRIADVVAGLGAVLLVVSLFLHWYADGGSPLSGWQALSAIDVLLALAAVPALLLPLVTAVAKGPAKPVALAVLATVGGVVALVLVAFRLIDPPGALAVRSGAWIALAGAILTLTGAWSAMADERTPGAVPPRVPIRPVP